MSDCIFCKIARGEMGTEFVVESENAVAFNDIAPAAPVHVLVIPKEHVESVQQLEDSHSGVWQEMLKLVQEVAVTTGVATSGYRLTANVGPDSGQEVPHLHFHVMGGQKLGPLSFHPTNEEE